MGATGCSSAAPRTIDPTSAAKQISEQFAAHYHVSPPAVSCPPGVRTQDGRTFVCTTTVDGHDVKLDAKVTDSSGHFSVTPSDPILEPSSVAAQLSKQIQKRTDSRPSVRCPGGRLEVVPVHDTLVCTATFTGQAPRQVVVTVVDPRGDFAFTLAPPA